MMNNRETLRGSFIPWRTTTSRSQPSRMKNKSSEKGTLNIKIGGGI